MKSIFFKFWCLDFFGFCPRLRALGYQEGRKLSPGRRKRLSKFQDQFSKILAPNFLCRHSTISQQETANHTICMMCLYP
jgi:hypothetical protein